MIARVILDGDDVTTKVLRGGVDKLVAEVSDEDGNLTVGNSAIRLSNLSGTLSGISETADALPLDVSINGTLLFRGDVAPENIREDPDQEIVTVDGIGSDRSWLDRLEKSNIADAQGSPYLLNIEAEPNANSVPAYAEGRFFYSFNNILTHLGVPPVAFTNLITGVDLTKYYYGGIAFNRDRANETKLNQAEFLKNVAMMFNAIYCVDSTGTLILKDKLSYLKSTDAPLDLPMIRGSFQQTVNRCGADSIEFRWANYDAKWVGFDGNVGGRVETRDPYALSWPRAILKESLFRQANAILFNDNGAPYYRSAKEWAYISRAESESTFIVKSATGATSIYEWLDVNATGVIDSWYACEFKGLTEWTATFSIMDNYTVLPELIKPYRKIAHPLGSQFKYFIRRAEIDPENETVKVTAVGYDI